MLYFSSLLQSAPQYRPAAARLFASLDAHGVRYGLQDNTRDIWLRDFMPVRRGDGKFVSFRYEPSYLKGCLDRRTDFLRDIRSQFWIFGAGFDHVICSDINLDGGNIVFSPSKSKVIISDRVFSENSSYERDALVYELERLLEAQVIIIPSLFGDLTGHADGMVRFADEDTVIGNATSFQNGLEQRIRAVLEREGLSVIGFPYCESSGISAAGCYLNYLETSEHIFLPVFGIGMDELAIEAAKRIFTKTIVPVRIDEIASDGGCLNCISWEIDPRDTEDYQEERCSVVICPICGSETLDLYHICPRCGWEYDGITEDAGFSGANGMTLREYKKQWYRRCGKENRD